MLPTERRDMLEQRVWNNPSLLPQMGRGATEIDSVPVHDGADGEIEAGCPESLAVKERSWIFVPYSVQTYMPAKDVA